MATDQTGNDNYTSLTDDAQTLVDAAIAAIIAAYADTAADGQKDNVRVLLEETIRLQEES